MGAMAREVEKSLSLKRVYIEMSNPYPCSPSLEDRYHDKAEKCKTACIMISYTSLVTFVFPLPVKSK